MMDLYKVNLNIKTKTPFNYVSLNYKFIINLTKCEVKSEQVTTCIFTLSNVNNVLSAVI